MIGAVGRELQKRRKNGINATRDDSRCPAIEQTRRWMVQVLHVVCFSFFRGDIDEIGFARAPARPLASKTPNAEFLFAPPRSIQSASRTVRANRLPSPLVRSGRAGSAVSENNRPFSESSAGLRRTLAVGLKNCAGGRNRGSPAIRRRVRRGGFKRRCMKTPCGGHMEGATVSMKRGEA